MLYPFLVNDCNYECVCYYIYMKVKAHKLIFFSIIFFSLKGMFYLWLGKYILQNSYWSHWFFIPIVFVLLYFLKKYLNKKGFNHSH